MRFITVIHRGDASSVLVVPWSASDPTSPEGHEQAKSVIVAAIKFGNLTLFFVAFNQLAMSL